MQCWYFQSDNKEHGELAYMESPSGEEKWQTSLRHGSHSNANANGPSCTRGYDLVSAVPA